MLDDIYGIIDDSTIGSDDRSLDGEILGLTNLSLLSVTEGSIASFALCPDKGLVLGLLIGIDGATVKSMFLSNTA